MFVVDIARHCMTYNKWTISKCLLCIVCFAASSATVRSVPRTDFGQVALALIVAILGSALFSIAVHSTARESRNPRKMFREPLVPLKGSAICYLHLIAALNATTALGEIFWTLFWHIQFSIRGAAQLIASIVFLLLRQWYATRRLAS
jgi:hypothetical protein